MKPFVAGGGSDALRSSYEDLRAQALAGGRGPGFALCTAVVAAIEHVPAPTNPQCMPPEMRSEIVSILAGLFLQKGWEATQ